MLPGMWRHPRPQSRPTPAPLADSHNLRHSAPLWIKNESKLDELPRAHGILALAGMHRLNLSAHRARPLKD